MPLPLIAWGAAALGAAVIGAVAHSSGEEKGYQRGYNEGKEYARAEINRLRKLLSEQQQEKERIRQRFHDHVNDIAQLDLHDDRFFAKIASLFTGYTNFHKFSLAVSSHCQSRCIELGIGEQAANELADIILGVVQVAFPIKMREQLRSIRDFVTIEECAHSFQLYKGKLKPELQALLMKTLEETIEPIVEELMDSINEIQEHQELLIHYESQVA